MFRFLCLLFLLFVGSVAGLLWALNQMDTPGPLSTDKTVLIPRGGGIQTIAQQLESEGVVSHKEFFLMSAMLEGKHHRLQAGEYAFAAHITPSQVVEQMAQGRVITHKITIPEGLNVRDIAALLMKEPLLRGELPSPLPPEGSLMPETYQFMRDDTRASILAQMQKSMQSVLQSLWKTRGENLGVSSIEEAVTLASIVEKETGLVAERPLIAGVFYNRLRKGMKLQSDPTVTYAIELARGPMNRALTSADLEFASPYNTYYAAGLPPGPIANPGAAALQAVLHPMPTDALYFVATGTGGHRFAATLAEHNMNVKLYRQAMEKARQTQAP